MSDIITTLHPENDADTNLYPNIKKENIPNNSIDYEKLSDDVKNIFANAIKNIQTPKYVTTLPTSDEGLVVFSDGYIYTWNGTQYVTTGLLYQAVEIQDNSIDISKINFRESLGLYNDIDSQLEENNSYQNYYINTGGTCTYDASLSQFYVYEYEVEANITYNIKGSARLGGSYPLVGFKTTSGVTGANNTPQEIIITGSSSQTDYDVLYTPRQNGYLFVAFVSGYGLTNPIPIYTTITKSTLYDETKQNTDMLNKLYFKSFSPTEWELGYYRANGTIGYYSNYCHVKFEIKNNCYIDVKGINGVGGSADAVSGILLDNNGNVLDVVTTQLQYSYYVNNVNAKYFAVCNGNINNVSNVTINVTKSTIIGDMQLQLQSDLSDKVIYTLGDSITYLGGSWAFQLANKIGCKKVYNLSRGGARYSIINGGAVYDENCDIWNNPFVYNTSNDGKTESYPSNTDRSCNVPMIDNSYAVVPNQIKFMDRLITEYNRPTPDIIVIACGINDTSVNTPIYSDDAFNSIINTPLDEMTNAQKITLGGGIRWCVETLMATYPNAEIILATPIQSDYAYLRPHIPNTCNWIKAFRTYYASKLIDAYTESGISGVFEKGHNDTTYNPSNAGRYLYDGLHPNDNGKLLMGNYFAKRIFEKHCNIK